jgi:hypothetical protein
VLRVGSRAAVAAGEDLAVGEQAFGEQRRGAGDGGRQRLDRVALQLRAVGEVLADSRDVIHGQLEEMQPADCSKNRRLPRAARGR